MVVQYFDSAPMAKRQKTNETDPSKSQSEAACGSSWTNDGPSDRMLGIIIAATRTPDMNIVEFSDTISEIEEIMSEPEPLSDTDLPPRPIKQKKKKSSKHSKHDKKPKSTELQTAVQDIAGRSSSQTCNAQSDSKP